MTPTHVTLSDERVVPLLPDGEGRWTARIDDQTVRVYVSGRSTSTVTPAKWTRG